MSENHYETAIPNITFDEVFSRLNAADIISNQSDLARLLEFSRPTITKAKQSNHIPKGWQKRFEIQGFNFNWITSGNGEKYNPLHSYFHKSIVFLNKIIKISDKGEARIGSSAQTFPLQKNFIEENNLYLKNIAYFVYNNDDNNPCAGSGDIFIIDTSKKETKQGKSYLLYVPDEDWTIKKIIKKSMSRIFFEKTNKESWRYVYNHQAVICGECIYKFTGNF